MNIRLRVSVLAAIVVSLSLSILISSPTFAAIPIKFPVIGTATYSNDYEAMRGDEKHHAIDIIAGKHQKVVAAYSGTITYVAYPQPSWGYMVRVASPGGYEFDYIHLNNDNKGTDDGKGGAILAYAPGVKVGNTVVKGQLLGYVGDSGNAETTVSHLHFEMRKNGQPYNPYASLNGATRMTKPVPAAVQANEILPYGGQKYTLNVAAGDIDANGTIETVVGAGKSEGPKVKIYNAAKQEIGAFVPFQSQPVKDTVDVAVGDVNGDGRNEIIVGGRGTNGSRIEVYNYINGVITALSQFVVDSGSQTIARVTAADVTGDTIAEIITGNGPSDLSAHVKIYSVLGVKLGDFQVFGDSFHGGIDVAAGDLNGDSRAEIVVSRLSQGSGVVRVFNADGTLQRDFWPYNGLTSGVRVAIGNVVQSSAKSEIVTIPTGVGPRLKVFDANGTKLQDYYFLENWWRGYYDPAAATGTVKTVTGINRRASVQ